MRDLLSQNVDDFVDLFETSKENLSSMSSGVGLSVVVHVTWVGWFVNPGLNESIKEEVVSINQLGVIGRRQKSITFTC
jgi:hypothetical protein